MLLLASLATSAALVRTPPGWRPPEPRMFAPSFPFATVAGGGLATALRGFSGIFAAGWRPGLSLGGGDGEYSLYGFRDTSPALEASARPAAPLVLYEYEASPYCRKVREACSSLALPVTMLPCPGARHGFAAENLARGGRMTVPYLEDPNTGRAMYESDDIVRYLYEAYGPGADAAPSSWGATAALPSLVRGMAGARPDGAARAENTAMEPLELWFYEGSPYARPVRERLTELCLPHTVTYTPRGGTANRDALLRRAGRFQVPFLADPNTGAEMFEGGAMVEYLDQVYTTKP